VKGSTPGFCRPREKKTTIRVRINCPATACACGQVAKICDAEWMNCRADCYDDKMSTRRLNDIVRFYELLDRLEHLIGGARRLSDCHGRLSWPQRGVYFFMENDEPRSDSGTGPRVVRIGTHAVTATSGATLWKRLSQHRGTARSGGGNHRGSVFRLLVGAALIGKGEHACDSWADKESSATPETRAGELTLEQAVTRHIGEMPFVWLGVDDAPGKESERGAIALLSNFEKKPLDGPSRHWLGRCSSSLTVRESGLWNQYHVQEDYDSAFLDLMESWIERGA
jgi:hypothetical protein